MRAGNHCGHTAWKQTLGTSNLGDMFKSNEISDMLNGE